MPDFVDAFPTTTVAARKRFSKTATLLAKNAGIFQLRRLVRALLGFVIVSCTSMRRLLAVVLLVGLSAPAVPAMAGAKSGGGRKDAREQVDFGITVAQRGLWKEALYRW